MDPVSLFRRGAPPRALAFFAAALALSGCAGRLNPLTMTAPSRSLSDMPPLPHKQAAPISVRILSIENAPTVNGKYAYPLRRIYAKAFKDAMAAAFAEGEEACAYTLEVTANKSELDTSRNWAAFRAHLTSVIRGPDNRVRGDALEYESEVAGKFDRHQVPDSLWAVSYGASRDLLKKIRDQHWFKVDLLQPPCEKTAVAAAPESAAPAAQPAPKKRQIISDVDTPNYRAEKELYDDYALIIGIEKYQTVPEAAYAERDAAAVKEHLLAMGVPERNIIYLTGAQAGKSSVQKYVESWLPKNLNERSRLFFYYSGHGAPEPNTGDTYLLPWDADPAFLEHTAYSKKALYAKLNALPSKQVVVAMDSCFSGADGVLGKVRPLVNVSEEKAEGRLIVFSAASSKEITGAKEDQGHGLFTYYFLKGLNGEAVDKKARGITAKSLSSYVHARVSDAARREGNRDQHPQFQAGSAGLEDALIRETMEPGS